MDELIKIDDSNDNPVVSARDLYAFLEVGARYNDWFSRMCGYGFTEGQDFYSFLSESTGGRPAQDATPTIDMAKESCMLQRNEKGKVARQYFLQLEKDWNSPEKVMARALHIADRSIKTLEAENEAQRQTIADFQPIKQYMDTILSNIRTLTITQIAADYDMSAKRLNKILRDAGIQRYVNGQWILYKQHMRKGYTKSKMINIVRSDGQSNTVLHMEWTQSDRIMIHGILTSRGIQAVIDKKRDKLA